MRSDYAITNIDFERFNSRERIGHFKINYEKAIKKLVKREKVLEIGPGDGSFLLYLTEKGFKKKQLFCVDQSKKTCLFIKKNKIIPSQNVYNTNIINFVKYRREGFDLIFMQHVIEHLKKRQINLFLKACKKYLLNENGILIIETPNVSNIIYGQIAKAKDYTHETVFTPKSIKEALMMAGFKEENILIRETRYYPTWEGINVIKYAKGLVLKTLFWISKVLSSIFYRGIGHNINSFNMIIEVKK